MNHSDRHYSTLSGDHEARRNLRISVARFTANLNKLERMEPEHAPAIERARKSALRIGKEHGR